MEHNERNSEMAQDPPSEDGMGITHMLTKTNLLSSAPATSSDIIQEEDLDLDPIRLEVDSSAEFLHSLEKNAHRYQIQKQLASGGFGRIFLAWDRILGRKAVVKSLRETLLDKPEAVQKFIAEAKLTAQMDHPGIVSVYSLESDNNNGVHLTMQLINGITLKKYLQRVRERQSRNHDGQKRYNQFLRERLEIFLHICDAIEYSHSRHIIHCDLKPENIMIGRFGEVYVMDWGSACLDGTSRKGHVEGTPSYVAPESFDHVPTSPLTDIFALGMILNEMATLRRPVLGNDSGEILKRIRQGEFEPSTPLDSRRKNPPALRAIIEKARAIQPERRYQTVKQLATDVRHFLFNEEVEAHPDSPWHKLMRLMYQHRQITLWLLLLLLATFSAILIWGMKRENLAIRKGNQDVLRYLNLQTEIEKLETQISAQLFLLQNQLKTLSLSLSVGTTLPLSDVHEPQCYEAASFKPGAKQPPSGLIPTPFYKNPISLQCAVYFREPGVSQETFREWGSRFRSLHNERLAIFFSNLIRQDNYVYSDEVNIRHFIHHGGRLRRITYVMDNGIALRFPGMYEEIASPKDLLCEEYRSQPPPHRLCWTSTYLDSSNHLVIACWRPVLDPSGKEIGAMSFEICFHELMLPIFERMQEGCAQTYFLLDSSDKEIFSSEQKYLEEEHNNPSSSVMKKPHFRYPEILKQIRESQQVQFTTVLDGRAVRISWKRIAPTNWLLIQTTPLDASETIGER